MSRGQSQTKTQPGRRTLERCKNKSSTGAAVVIDVDQAKSDVVFIDVPESSHRRFTGSTSLKRNKRIPSVGVISIDDDDDDNDGPKHADGSRSYDDNSSSRKFCPFNKDSMASSKFHPSSSENCHFEGSDECQMFVEKQNFPSNRARNVGEISGNGPSRNRFGLDDISETSASESDSSGSDTYDSDFYSDDSDCEILEDCSGKIREEWEKAALRKRASKGMQSEDLASDSGSSMDPGIKSKKSPCGDFEQSVNHSNDETGSQEREDPASCKVQSNGDHQRAEFHNKEKPDSGNFSNCGTRSQCETHPKDGKTNVFDVNDGDGSQYTDDPASCKVQSQGEAPIYHERAESHNKREVKSDQSPTWDTQPQCKMHPKDGETRELNEDTEATGVDTRDHMQDSLKKTSPSGRNVPSRCNGSQSVAHTGQRNVRRFQGKEEQCIGKTPPGFRQSGDEIKFGHERSSFQENEDAVLENGSSGTLKQQKAHILFKENSVVSEPSLRTSQPQGVAQINSSSPLLGKEGLGDVPSASNPLQRDSAVAVPEFGNDLLGGREKHKESDEYKRVVEEEWAARERELRMQAEEAQRLKKRKKAESLRLLDMERRQKQRVEEIRETQKKDEETINLKEKLRMEIRKELALLELKHRDLASVLRGLGINVGGGLFPGPSEVNVAYKKALLKFHPDRASRLDLRQQVEAEEKFKLISRLKEKMLPVA
ncbi:hypothetical protein QJS04_geneDACA005284 [Acorus gramineus]|uniref:J domain-containing protein n=1 Tax=Acorus gramineus TaxID=55184 RepID=A0AAV9B0G0_ACOGR|nr:hypothetical protein QJS04_geneDACA005284 [Acorus gramineus]